MAAFCTKCGTPNAGDTQFCTKCGAPLDPVGTGPAATPGYAPPIQPMAYGQPAGAVQPAATGGGSSALKIILIIVGVFVGLGILSVCAVMFGLWRVSRAVHVSGLGNGGTSSVTTPLGTVTTGGAGSVSASDLGVDLYPGASAEQGAVRVSTPGGAAITAAYTTSDSLEKVVEFYKEKLGAGASVFQSDKSAVLSETDTSKKTSVMVTVETESNGTTKFSILHSTSNGS